MIALIDYGVGNLYSVEKALNFVGGDVKVTNSAKDLQRAEKIILPGVGAFGDCMKNLEEEVAKKKFFLGICVGLQILFEESEESPNVKGLGIFKGKVKKISAGNLKIPHMGWNSVEIKNSKIFSSVKNNSYFYFVHSYHAVPFEKNLIVATTDYGEKITAAVEFENIFATQFHPEKSGDVGLQVLRNFVEL